MDQELSKLVDIRRLEEETRTAVEQDKLYWVRNSAKIRAATTGTASYEEFRQLVCAAHLKPLEKKDAVDPKQQRTVWNPVYKQKQNF